MTKVGSSFPKISHSIKKETGVLMLRPKRERCRDEFFIAASHRSLNNLPPPFFKGYQSKWGVFLCQITTWMISCVRNTFFVKATCGVVTFKRAATDVEPILMGDRGRYEVPTRHPSISFDERSGRKKVTSF